MNLEPLTKHFPELNSLQITKLRELIRSQRMKDMQRIRQYFAYPSKHKAAAEAEEIMMEIKFGGQS